MLCSEDRSEVNLASHMLDLRVMSIWEKIEANFMLHYVTDLYMDFSDLSAQHTWVFDSKTWNSVEHHEKDIVDKLWDKWGDLAIPF